MEQAPGDPGLRLVESGRGDGTVWRGKFEQLHGLECDRTCPLRKGELAAPSLAGNLYIDCYYPFIHGIKKRLEGHHAYLTTLTYFSWLRKSNPIQAKREI